DEGGDGGCDFGHRRGKDGDFLDIDIRGFIGRHGRSLYGLDRWTMRSARGFSGPGRGRFSMRTVLLRLRRSFFRPCSWRATLICDWNSAIRVSPGASVSLAMQSSGK